MTRGSKVHYTIKQRRQANHIEESEKQLGRSAKEAARIAFATLNKQSRGGNKSGSRRGKQLTQESAQKGKQSSERAAA